MNEVADQIANFFAGLSPQMTTLLAIIGLLVFTVGLILGWLIQRRSTRRFRQQAILLKTDRDALEAARDRLEGQNQALARELELVSSEKVGALDRVQELEADSLEWRQTRQEMNERAAQLKTTNDTYASTIDSLNDQVIGLKTRNEHLLRRDPFADADTGAAAGAGGEGSAGGGARVVDFDDPFAGHAGEGVPLPTDSASRLNAGPAGGRSTLAPANSNLEARLQYLEDRLASLSEQRELAAGPGALYSVHQTTAPVATDAGGEPLVIRADTAEGGIRSGHGGAAEVIVQHSKSLQTPAQPTEDPGRDDLTQIAHVGPFLESQLNKVDIYRFEQIAGWTDADIVTYTELIGYLPGVIERDDWVGQARKLAEGSDNNLKTYTTLLDVATIDTPVRKDETETPNRGGTDLQLVEGIGPRIQSLLSDNGIETLGDLADSTTERLQGILDAAGGSFRFHDPKTWVAQAGLAADGKLAELREWQQQLLNGL